ncbi:DEAD/DEAH box helicase [Pseudogemmobacter humi]|uniref:DEAD-box ATP-dependent RNA helicase RhpA n=1 Tax=Pseudogemmobacter humi TaxID=2483812 RepID=A0A3P5X7G9_9RHOB|nr:DEAD/DEAH box helicase [Pseudogemmobacter humi]VDC30349.1 ATP-dependent RNA helicase RhlE [Pseudogemmobacter humi]
MTTFEALGLSPKILKALEKTALKQPTPIQAQAIPQIMQGRDLMGLAQTGTGKTAAFGLPLLHRLLDIGHPPGPKNIRALILVPTRELATQIKDNFLTFTQGTAVKVVMVVGGASVNRQAQSLLKGADVLVATPGRLIDLIERGDVSLEKCGYLVLDEADHMLDMGFIHSLRRIAKHIPLKRQTLMFSATMPKDITEIAETYLRDPVKVQVAPPGKPAEKVTQGVHFIPNGDKARLLEEYLKKHPGEAALVFSRTKHGADKLAKVLAQWGFRVGAIHGNRSQNQRDRILTEFRQGEVDVLVATDVAARGIDIPTVRHVYNYDMPNVPENYVHRIGRTARAGAEGSSLSFCAPAEMGELQAVEKLLKKSLPVLGGAPWAADVVAAAPKPGQNRGQRPQGQRGPRPGAGPGKQGAGKPSSGPKPAARPGAARPQGGGGTPSRRPGGTGGPGRRG